IERSALHAAFKLNFYDLDRLLAQLCDGRRFKGIGDDEYLERFPGIVKEKELFYRVVNDDVFLVAGNKYGDCTELCFLANGLPFIEMTCYSKEKYKDSISREQYEEYKFNHLLRMKVD